MHGRQPDDGVERRRAIEVNLAAGVSAEEGGDEDAREHDCVDRPPPRDQTLDSQERERREHDDIHVRVREPDGREGCEAEGETRNERGPEAEPELPTEQVGPECRHPQLEGGGYAEAVLEREDPDGHVEGAEDGGAWIGKERRSRERVRIPLGYLARAESLARVVEPGVELARVVREQRVVVVGEVRRRERPPRRPLVDDGCGREDGLARQGRPVVENLDEEKDQPRDHRWSRQGGQ
jgi:hypothetical protein